MKKIIFLIILSLILINCSQSTKYANLGKKAELDGDYHQASKYYQSSLKDNAQNKTAIEGLNRTSSMVLNDTYTKFENFYDFDDFDKSYDVLTEIEKKVETLNKLGISVTIKSDIKAKMLKVRNFLAKREYDLAEKQIGNKRWQDALYKLESLQKYRKEYMDSVNLIAKCHYSIGKNFLNKAQYRKAYNSFTKCLDKKANYQNARRLKQQALDNGKIVVYVKDIENSSRISGLSSNLKNEIIRKLKSENDPFLQFSSTNLNSADYELQSTLKLVKKETSKLKKSGKIKCYEVTRTKQSDGTFKANGKKTWWQYCTQSRSLTLSIAYKLVKKSNNEIVFNDYKTSTEYSSVEYGEYPGSYPSLLEPWSPNAKGGTVLLDSYHQIKGTAEAPLVDPKYFRRNKKLTSYDYLAQRAASDLIDATSSRTLRFIKAI